MFAALTATTSSAAVVQLTSGSTSGYTFQNGNTYVVTKSLTFSNSSASSSLGSGMSVPENATVVLYVPKGVTLTAKGAKTYAGINVPKTATLVITGEGTVSATGGNAGNGGNGSKGGNGSAYINDAWDFGATGGSGGSGGSGGWGAGAGIGGDNAQTMGTCYVLGTIAVSAQQGNSGTSGTAGGKGTTASVKKLVQVSSTSAYWMYCYGPGGGGGGAGCGGSAPYYAIGGGGSDGNGGGNGYQGHALAGLTEESTVSPGANGSNGTSKGNAGGNGTLYVSPTATVNVDRTKLEATTHPAAQYTITFNANGGTLSSSTSSLTATLGCALPDCIPAPTKSGSVFRGWTTGTGGTMFYSENGTKQLTSYDRTANTPLYAIWETKKSLVVSSAHGTCTPAIGSSQHLSNSVIRASVATPAAQQGSRFVCTGWTGTGSVPASGTATNVTFTITKDSTLTWNWKTQYQIAVTASGAGSCSFGTKWVDSGTTATAAVVPSTSPYVISLSGDSDGVTLTGTTLSIPSDKPRTIVVTVTALDRAPTTLYVNGKTGNDSNDGTSSGKAFKTIQKAVEMCIDGDTILVAPGVYKETADNTGGVYNRNSRNATVRSTDGPLATIIDGDGARRVVKGTASSTQDEWETHCLLFDGFTLRNGYRDGAAAVAWGKFNNCIISGNVSPGTSGVSNDVRLENCLIVDNVASNLEAKARGLLFVRTEAVNCTIVGNRGTTADGAAGIEGGSLANCIVFGNDFGDISRSADEPKIHHTAADSSLEGEGSLLLSSSPFVNAADGNYRLRANSPCVDAGANEFVSTDLDLRGSPRVVNGTVDAGCYEYREPVTWHVDATSGNDAKDGLSWSTAKKSIQAAVDASAIDDTILVADGVYEAFSAENRRGITIRSVNGAERTIVDGGGVTRCASLGVDTNDVVKTTLVGFTLRNGRNMHGTGAKGGIVEDCIVTGNYAGRDDNPGFKGYGGGLYGCIATGCVVSNNAASNHGGGAHGSVLVRCIVSGNVAEDDGGGAISCVLTDCLVSGNEARNAGGTSSGGGIIKSTAIRCTIVGNRAVYGSSSTPGSAGADNQSVLQSCIVFGNVFTTGESSDIYNSTATYSCFGSTVSGTGNIVSDPLFVDAANGDYRLQAGSPCIDAGTGSGITWSTDLAGFPRRMGWAPDMGCYEFVTHREPTTLYVDAATGDDTNDGLSPAAPKQSIQSALEWSIDGDTILVGEGVYTRNAIVVNNENHDRVVTIRSVNGPERTIIDGGGSSRCVKLSANHDGRTSQSVATLSGFTITNGSYYTSGGVSHGIVENCIITDCTGTRGNTSGSDYAGGAVQCKLVNCLVSGNSVVAGDGNPVAGGAWRCDLFNCTVVGNEAVAGASAGGLYDCKAYNCIIQGNTVGGIAADVAACTLDHCCLTSLQEGEGNLVAFPKFADEANGDYRLLGNSPCIDAGSDANAAGDSDLWGNARVQGAHVDIGAYEAGPESWLKVEGTDVVYNGGPNALTVTADFPGAEATILYGLSADGPFMAEAPSFTDAGEHPVWVVATAPGYPAVTNAATLLVRKKQIEPSMMFVVPDQVWDGTAKTPEVHIRDGWPDILGAENYDVEYVDNVDVGTAGVRVTGKNNYDGSFVYPFGIDPVDETRFLVVDLSGGTNATSYPVSYLSDVPAGGWTDEYKTTKLVLRKVPEGSFWMGSPEDEVGRQNNETLHRVTLSRGFYAGVFEVTQKQWELVMGTNVAKYVGIDHPVEMVSYNMIRGAEAGTNYPASSAVDATSFLGVLRAKTGLGGFDLPTEAQWEYVCRAGTESALNSGKELETVDGNSRNLAEVGCYAQWHPAETKHGAVGLLFSNRWGLFDMHGNVWELCRDWMGDLSPKSAVNPIGADSGEVRVVRGGSWGWAAYRARSAHRYDLTDVPPRRGHHTGGFRIVCEDPEPAETVWYVDAERGDDENTGRSWDDALRTIQNAADRSVAGNMVLVTNGVYEPFTAMNKDIVIRSVEGAEKTIVDGGGTNRCATLGESTNEVSKTTLVGFTLRNGSADIGGGAKGGLLEDCIVENNESTIAKADYCGGGAAHAVLQRCIVRNNRCEDDGGGVSGCVLYDCLVTGNHSENGGGAGGAGGVDNSTVVRCTIVGNTAVRDTSDKGPGGAGSSASKLVGSIVWGNMYTDGTADAPYKSTATYSCFDSSVSGTGNIVADPLFVDAANGDYRLQAGSPCIDAGQLTNEAKMGTDLDGHPRWIGVGTDMGCYEWATHYAATTQYVAQATGNDANDGLSWETAKATIQNAIDWAADGDEIVVADGVYTGDTTSFSSILNRKNARLHIRSVNGPLNTVIDGRGLRRCVQMTVRPPTAPENSFAHELWRDYVTMDGFTLRNGYCTAGGGAALSVSLKNCIVTGNSTRSNSAVSSSNMENCLVFGNANENANQNAVSPSAVANGSLINCTIVANTNRNDLGACAIRNCTVTNCIIVGNIVVDSPVENEVDVATCKVGYSCLDTETAGTSNIVASAADLFFDAAKGDYRVRAVAPCVDAGDTSRAAGGTDLAGNPRVAHAAVDMGCHEYGVPATPVIEPGDGSKFAKNTQSVTLTCSDPDARIFHTVDGSDPWTNSTTSVKFSIRETTTVKAVAIVRDDWASEVATATIVRVYVAQAPDGLAAAQEGAGIALTWDGVETADSYRVYRGSSPDLAAATLLGSTEGLSWSDATVEAGKTYYYFVVSENIAGVSDAGVPALGSTLTLATAVNMPQLAFSTGDGSPWVAELSEDAADAVHDARSGAPGDNGESWIETTVEGPGQIDFRWRASCERDDSGERDWDHLVFEIDGEEKARLDGRTKWERLSFAIAGEGTHTLRWTYVKDATMAAGEDRGWLDCVQWIPEATKGEWEAWVDFHGIGSPSGYEALKPLPSGKGDTLYEEFVAGLNPLDALSSLLADILVPGDEPEISWHPDLGARRVYTVEGKPFLTNEVWTAPNADSRFFRVWVRMPE